MYKDYHIYEKEEVVIALYYNETGRKIEKSYPKTITFEEISLSLDNEKTEIEKENKKLEEENKKLEEEKEEVQKELNKLKNTVADVITSGNVERLNNSVEEWKFNPSTITNEEDKFEYNPSQLVKYKDVIYLVTNTVKPTQEQTPDVAINFYRRVKEEELNIQSWEEVQKPVSTGTLVIDNNKVYRYKGSIPGHFRPIEDLHSWEDLGLVSEYKG